MKNVKVFSLLVITTVLFSACSWLGGESGKEADAEFALEVQEGLNNLSEIKSGNYELTFDGTVSTTDETAGFGTMDMVIDLSGAYDNSVKDNPKFSLKLAAAGSADEGEEEKAYGEVRIVDSNLYFVVSELSDFDGQLPPEMVEPFLGQWWSIPLPPEATASFNAYSGDEEDMTPEEKQLKELFEKTVFFKDVTYVGEEDVSGTASSHYKGTLDEEAVIDYIIESQKVEGLLTEEGEEAERADLQANFDKVTMSGDIWISKTDKIIVKWEGNLSMDDLDGWTTDFEMTYMISNLNGAVDVPVPEGAEVFDLFSAMTGGAVTSDAYGDFGSYEDLGTYEDFGAYGDIEGEVDLSEFEGLEEELAEWEEEIAY